MSSLDFIQIRIIEQFLLMQEGYVLDFSNQTLKSFTIDSVQKDIYEQIYTTNGTSKAKRLKTFLEIETDEIVVKLLKSFSEYIQHSSWHHEMWNNTPSDSIFKSYEEIVENLQKNILYLPIKLENEEKITKEFAKRQLEKIQKRQNNGDFEGVITSCRSLFENVMKEIYLEKTKLELDCTSLVLSWKILGKELSLSNEKELSDSLKNILRGFVNIIQGMSEIRNSSSDAHSQIYKPERHHSKLVINSIITLIDFLYDTLEFQKFK